MSNAVSIPSPVKPLSRRRALVVGAGALAAVGAAAALARSPRRADGLPAAIDLASARPLGDGFFLVDGWVLTAEDLKMLKAPAAPALP